MTESCVRQSVYSQQWKLDSTEIVATVQTLAPNEIISARWQRPHPDILALFLYSGRKWRHIVHLHIQSLVTMEKYTSEDPG